MPVQRKMSARSLCSGFTLPRTVKIMPIGEKRSTHRDVKGMQPDKRVIRRAKKIRADGQTFLENQALHSRPVPTRKIVPNAIVTNHHKPNAPTFAFRKALTAR